GAGIPMIDEWRIHVEHRTAVDELEPLETSPADLREVAQKYTAIINAVFRRIESGFIDGNYRSVATAYWGCAYALGVSVCEGTSMTEKAEQLGVGRATISKAARTFIEANSLPPSWYMKKETDHYVKSRLAQVAASNGNGAGP